jgi:transposase
VVRPARRERTNLSVRLITRTGVAIASASLVWRAGLFGTFTTRRHVAAYAGLAPRPWQRGRTDRDQGIAHAGTPRLRHVMIALAWVWLRHQPGSAVSRWVHHRVGTATGGVRRIAIVAVARKRRVALGRSVTQGILPQGATVTAA